MLIYNPFRLRNRSVIKFSQMQWLRLAFFCWEFCHAHLWNIIYKILCWYDKTRKPNMLCKYVRIRPMHNHSQSDSLGCLRWSSYLTFAQPLDGDWEKQREGSWSKTWCLSQGWKLWMFLHHCSKSCRLLYITLQPQRLKKETEPSQLTSKKQTKKTLCLEIKHFSALNRTLSSHVVFFIFV